MDLLETKKAGIVRDVKQDFINRASRATSFITVLQNMTELDFLPKAFKDKIAEILKTRNPNEVSKLNEAEVVNIGLISDGLERYRRLIDEFFGLLGMGFLGTFLEKQGKIEDYFKINADGKDLVLHLAENMPDQFFETPRVCVGTFHSVKGGECDHVWIDPGITVKIKKH